MCKIMNKKKNHKVYTMRKIHEITSIRDLDKLFSLSIGTFYIIKFGSSWCGPCQQIKERYNNLCQDYNNMVFLNIDTDNDNSDNVIKLSEYFNIKNLPTFLVIKSLGNLPSNKDDVKNIILHQTEGIDLSSLIYFLNNINYELQSEKNTNINPVLDRFEAPNINFNREIGYNSNLNENVYGHFIDNKNNNSNNIDCYEKDNINYFPY